jgi:HSP20 family protein
VDLPGLKPKQVTVEFKDGALWITGERKEEKEEKDKTYHRIERSYGEFRRVLPLSSAVKDDEIEAKFTDGVLKVLVPKTEEAKTRRIEVKS